MTTRTAIYPGSFDPVTLGHMNIIRRAAALFPRLVVVVGYNPNKKTLFSLDERMRFIREACCSLSGVEVDSFSQELLVHYARRTGATVVVRGLRGIGDYENEFQQSQMNQRMMPELETVFLFADPSELFISSTTVRETIRSGGDYRSLVPSSVVLSQAD